MQTIDTASPWGTYKPKGPAALILRLCHRLPAESRVYYSIIKTLRGPLRKFGVRPYDVVIENLRLRLVNRGNYCETTALFAPQFYDREEIAWLCAELSEGGTFLDIGGNVGLYSLFVAGNLNGKVDIYTVEPDPKLNARMMFNANENRLNIHLVSAALSDYEGEGALFLSTHQNGQNVLNNSGNAEASINVRVTTLLNLCRQMGISAIRALKIDVEGHEHPILSSFFSEAEKRLWPEAMVIEHVHDKQRIVDHLLENCGYRIDGKTPRNLLLKRLI
jgi:FkbM family methyltransferase